MDDLDTPNTKEVATDELEALKAEVTKWKTFSRKHEDELKNLRPLAEKWTEHEKTVKPKEVLLQEELQALRDSIALKEQEALDKEAATARETKITTFISENKLPEEAKKVLSRFTDEEFDTEAPTLLPLFAAPKLQSNPLQGLGGEQVTDINVDPLEAAIQAAMDQQK